MMKLAWFVVATAKKTIVRVFVRTANMLILLAFFRAFIDGGHKGYHATLLHEV